MITYLIGAGLGLIGAIIYNLIKGQSAEAELKNLTTREEVTTIQGGINTDQAALQAEKDKQDKLNQQAQQEQNQSNTKDELLNNLNKKVN